MSLPSPGPVDLLYTWAQFRDLFERGIIVEPVTYSGLTIIGTKFTVRRRIVIERRGRAFLSNKLSLQSIIITDSISTIPSQASTFVVVPGAGLTAVKRYRLENPKGSGKTIHVTAWAIVQEAAGNLAFDMYQAITPSKGSDNGTLTNVDIQAGFAKGPFTFPTSPPSGSIANFYVGVGTVQGEVMHRYFGSGIGSILLTGPAVTLPILPPDSAFDLYQENAVAATTILSWFEQ